MKSHAHAFITAVSDRWADVLPQLSKLGVRSQLHRSTELGKLAIKVESSKHVALIEGWERGHSLDVTVLHMASGESTILSSGSCENEAEISTRLFGLRDTLLKSDDR